ncbi:MAG: protein kinase [Planctomycetota bacterium]
MPHSPPSHDDEELQRLVEQCILRFESEGSQVVDELCRSNPEHADALRSRIDNLARLGFLGPERSPEIPDRLGEFRLLERIGVGGMGVVYLARQESLGREVALKLVRPEHLYFPGARERFQREVEAVARLDHPGIVRVYQVGEENGIPYFTMELARGTSLAQLVEALAERDPGRLAGADLAEAWRDLAGRTAVAAGERDTGSHALEELFRGSYVQCVARIVLQVAEALAHAHARGVLHRDVKASNVMLTPDGRVLLLDFGLAWTEGADALTRSGAMLGSLPYMAPEQVRGDNAAIDERTDVHGLGVLLYELLTLRLPHAARDGERLRQQILQGELDPPSRRNPLVARDVETVCMQALAPEPDRRYRDAGSFARDLQNFLEYRPIEARRPGLPDRVRRYALRHPARATAIVAAVLVVLLAPAGYAWSEIHKTRELQELESRKAHELGELLVAKETERRRAEDNARVAEENLARARKEHERAEANLEQANKAIEKLVIGVTRDRFADFPGMDAVREDLLEEAVRIYEKLEPSDASSGRYAWKRGRALLHVALLRSRMGQLDQAEADLQRVCAMLEAIPEEVTGRFYIDSDLALALKELARVHGRTGRMSEAQALFDRAIRTMRGAVEDRPELWIQRIEFSAMLHDMANLRIRAGKPAEATTWIDEAEAVLDGTRGGNEASVLMQEAVLAGDRGRVAQLQERFDEAKAAYDKGISVLDSLAGAGEQLDVEQRMQRIRLLGDYGLNLCGLALEQKDYEAAFARSGETLARREALYDLAPDRPDHVNLLASARSIRGDLLMQRGKKEEGLQQMREAARLHAALLEGHPKDPVYMRRAGISIGSLAFKLDGDEGREWQARALGILEELVAGNPKVPAYRDDLGVLLIESARREPDREEAVHLLTRAEDQFRAARGMQAGAARYLRNLSIAQYECARRLVVLGRLGEARDRLVENVRELGFDPRLLQAEEFAPLREFPEFAALLR